MSIELKQAAQDAAEAIDWLLKNIRLDAPQLSGKAMGNAEKCASALRAAIQQAEAQQPATGEPVLFIHPDTFAMNNAHVGAWKPGHELTGYTPLYTHPAPSDDVVLDAARYRWLRDERIGNCPESINLSHGRKPGLDAAIDAAMIAAK